MAHPETFSMENSVHELRQLIQDVNELLESRQASERASYMVNLVVEEILTNCLKYGFGDSGDHSISVSLRFGQDEIRVSIVDDGGEFDPCCAANPDRDIPTLDCEPGGLGLHLVRNMSKSMEYERKDNKNHLHVIIDAEI